MSEYVKDYIREQTHFMMNSDDPDLGGDHSIRVDLPSVESFFKMKWEDAIKQIDGYGLPPHQQKFDYYRDNGYFKLPAKLENIEQTIRKRATTTKERERKLFAEDYFEEIETNPLFYKDEIEFIKITIKRSLQGYWCFIKGRPTYIDGWHYTYLNYWAIDNDNRRDRLPDYRDIDRRIFLFFRWAYTTKDAHFKYEVTYRKSGEVRTKYFNNKASAMKFASTEVKGTYLIDDNEGRGYDVDMGYRTVFGVVFPKRRRVGATFMASHVGTRIACDNSMGTFAIQALTEETATNDVYKGKVIKPWSHYPFFFKPCANPNDTNSLVFTKKNNTSFGGDIVQHGGWVIPRSSANKAFDGNKLFAYLNDESGKKKDSDVGHEFADTIRNALAQGQSIHGFSIYTSTFGEFESGGGKEYFQLCKTSYSHRRNDNGLTGSGMVTLFVPAYDGYDGYVDEYGYSVIENPDDPFVNLSGEVKEMGAKAVLQNERDYHQEYKNWKALDTEIRSNPFTLREAGSKASRSNFWDITTLKERIATLNFGGTQTREVNLEWTSGRWSEVKIVDPTPEKPARFILSLPPAEQLRTKFVYDEQTQSYSPNYDLMGKYVLGCDPFSFDNKDTTGKKKSNGGGAMYMCIDPMIDHKDKPTSEYVTGDFCMTYNNRVETTDEYCEDMLMAAVLFGAMVYSERNVGHVLKHFRAVNADGYLLHNIDPITGKADPVAGVRTTTEVHEKIFGKFGDYVRKVGTRARHLEVLQQIQEAQSFDDMTDLDLFAAGGMALLGAESKYPELFKKGEETKDVSGFIDMYD